MCAPVAQGSSQCGIRFCHYILTSTHCCLFSSLFIYLIFSLIYIYIHTHIYSHILLLVILWNVRWRTGALRENLFALLCLLVLFSRDSHCRRVFSAMAPPCLMNLILNKKVEMLISGGWTLVTFSTRKENSTVKRWWSLLSLGIQVHLLTVTTRVLQDLPLPPAPEPSKMEIWHRKVVFFFFFFQSQHWGRRIVIWRGTWPTCWDPREEVS